MSDFDEILETEEDQITGVIPELVKVLAILSYIGHGFLIIIMLIGMAFFASASSSNLGGIMGAQMNGMIGVIIVIFILFIGLSIMSIIGAVKMQKGKKIGFVLFAIGSGLLGVVFLLSGAEQFINLVLGLIMIGLVVAFGTQLKYLK